MFGEDDTSFTSGRCGTRGYSGGVTVTLSPVLLQGLGSNSSEGRPVTTEKVAKDVAVVPQKPCLIVTVRSPGVLL